MRFHVGEEADGKPEISSQCVLEQYALCVQAMTEQATEIIFLLDRSGSMHICESDTIGGYNSLLERQKREAGCAYVTTVLFDNHYELLCEHVDIRESDSLSAKEYFARGSTALLDAIGLTISRSAKRQEESGAATKTLMVIITDGLDNMSRVYSIKTIYDMIHECERRAGSLFFWVRIWTLYGQRRT